MVKYDIFYANNVDKIIEDLNNGWRQILERSVYLSSTLSVLNLKNELLNSKEDEVYVPLLNAFMKEINFQIAKENTIPRKLVEYLLSKYDFYKIISKFGLFFCRKY